MHQARAIHKLFPKGKPSVKARILSIIGVIGCISANHLIPPDMVSVGAKPELMKGKIKSGNIKPLEPSGDFEISPHSTASNEIAMFTKISKAATISQSTKPLCGRKPRTKAVIMITVLEIVFLTTPAPV